MRIHKILVVDDDRDLARMVADFLSDKGYCVMQAFNGIEALAIARSQKPDLITLDLLMPKINGIKFLETLRADPELTNIPVVIVSVVAEKQDKDNRVFHLGVADWLTKPFEFDEMLRVIQDSESRLEKTDAPRKVVIIDDDPNVSETVKSLLESGGYSAVAFTNDENIVEKVAAENPFLVLIDIQAADLNAVAVIRALKTDARTAHVPAIALSGLDVNEVKRQCLLAGATEYYAGSFTSETFLDELQGNIIKYEMNKIQRHAKVLVADDDADLARLAMDNLKAEGFETVYAYDGVEAMRLIPREMPDLLLLDINMPRKDGYQVFKEVKADILLANIPVIIVTARATTREKVFGLELGADDYITKPYDLEELVARVKMILRRTSVNRELNPLTRLPGNVAIEEAIIASIKKDEPFAALYVDVNHFKAYNDFYGFTRGDDVIKTTARVMLESLKELDCREDFIGHIGGDDFIILTVPGKAEALSKRIIEKFDAQVPMLYDPQDRERGYIVTKDRKDNTVQFPLLTISIGIATTLSGKISSLGEVSKIGSEMKAFAKKNKGSFYSVDQRQKPV